MTGNGNKKQRSMRYENWVEPEKLILIRGWAREGLSNEQIAHNAGISETTFYKWQREHAEFAQALKQGKEVVDFMVENALFKNATGGNVAAQIFWLKNRKPDKWKEHQEMTIEAHNDESIKAWIDALKD